MASLAVNTMDVIVLVTILVCALICFSLGFVRVVLAIGAWIGAGLATVSLMPLARPIARQLTGDGQLFDTVPFADLAAGLTLFLISLVFLWLISHFISERIRRSALNVLDRSLGALLGLVIAAVIISMGYAAYSWVAPPESQPDWVREARVTPLAQRGADLIGAVVVAFLDVAEREAEMTNPLSAIGSAVGLTAGKPSETGDTAPASSYTNDQQTDLDRLVDQVESEDASP
jgi:membrane protein required for colicin V production